MEFVNKNNYKSRSNKILVLKAEIIFIDSTKEISGSKSSSHNLCTNSSMTALFSQTSSQVRIVLMSRGSKEKYKQANILFNLNRTDNVNTSTKSTAKKVSSHATVDTTDKFKLKMRGLIKSHSSDFRVY